MKHLSEVSGFRFQVLGNNGYTLIEILVYASLLALMIALIANSAASLMQIVRDAKGERELRASAEAVLERIAREVRFAEAVDVGASTLDTHPGVLALTTIDPFSENPQTVTFSFNGGRVTVQKGAGPIDYLTSNGVNVSNLVFRRIANGAASESVKTELTIDGKNFYTTTVLRRSY